MHPLFPTYFAPEELQVLRQLEGRILTHVSYIIWRNLASREGTYEVLEWIELGFADGFRLGFTAGPESDGVHLGAINLAEERAKVKQQFKGQVELAEVDMGDSSTWKSLVGEPLTSLGMGFPIGEDYPNDRLELIFVPHRIEIALNEEGLLARKV